MDVARLLSRSFMKTHPDTAASVLEKHSPEELISLFRKESAATRETLRHVSPYLSASVLSSLKPEDAASILLGFPEELSVRVLRQMSESYREGLLDTVSAELAGRLRSRLRYPDGVAATYADPHILTLQESVTAGDALKLIRKSIARVQYYLYILDTSHRLAGIITLRELFAASPHIEMAAIMNRDVSRIAASSQVEEFLLNPNWRKFHALPVVDTENRFIGVIRHETLQELREEVIGKGDGDRLVETLFAISEIYWNGLAGFLRGFGTGIQGPPASPPHHGVAQDANK